MTAPMWEPVDNDTADLLSLVAMGSSTGSADEEWGTYVESLRWCAVRGQGTISPNMMRRQVRDHIAPRRIGAFTNRALSQGLVEYTGEWVVSDDTEGRNGGKPCRVMRWIGGAL